MQWKKFIVVVKLAIYRHIFYTKTHVFFKLITINNFVQ